MSSEHERGSDESVRHLLLVEHDPASAGREAAFLEANGFAVTTLSSSAEAVELIRRGAPVDLVLLDVDEPAPSPGQSAAQMIGELRDVPIVFVTSRGDEEIDEQIERSESYGYIVRGSGKGIYLASIRMALRLHEAHVRLDVANRELRRSEARLAAIFDYLPFDVSVSSLEARYELQNRVSREHFGEAIGRTPDELGAPPELAAEWRRYHRRATLGELVAVERHYQFGAQDRWVREVMAPIPMGDRVVAALGVNIDITEQKRAELTLRETEERLRATLQSIGDGVMSTDVTGRITEMNRVTEQLTGWSVAEARGLPIEKVFHIVNGRTRERAPNPVDRALAEGKVVGFANDTTLIARDGSERVIADSAAPIRSADGRVLGTILVFRDVTESYQMRRAVEESATRFRSLFSNMVEGVALHELVMDDSGAAVNYRIIDVNPAYERIIGLPRSRVVGRLVTDGLGTEAPPYLDEYVGVALSGEAMRFETYFEPMGRHFEISVVPWGAAGFATVFADVTGRKNAERELARALEENQALYRELQHRIKNSLTLIRSLINLERNLSGNERVGEILARIQDRIGSLADFYAMLDESGEAGHIPLDGYLNRVVNSLASVYLHDRKHPSIVKRFERVLVETRTATSIGLIVNELVTNVLKHAFPPDREGTLELSLAHDGDEVVIEISDDGEGPPADFDLSRPMGLGLQLVVMLTAQLSGKVSFERDARNSFRIRLPLTR